MHAYAHIAFTQYSTMMLLHHLNLYNNPQPRRQLPYTDVEAKPHKLEGPLDHVATCLLVDRRLYHAPSDIVKVSLPFLSL